MYKPRVYYLVMLDRLKSRLINVLKMTSCVAIIAIGIPVAYELIPFEIKPSSIWEFSNSVLLMYLSVLTSMIVFSGDQKDN